MATEPTHSTGGEPPKPGASPFIRWRGGRPTRESVKLFAGWVRRLRARAEWTHAPEDRDRLEAGKTMLARLENQLAGK